MKLGARGRLFLVSMGLVLVVGAASLLYLEVELRGWLEQRVEMELRRSAGSARIAVEAVTEWGSVPRVQPLAQRLGAATGARVTIMDRAGRVLGDSNVTEAAVPDLENHATRPEVLALGTAPEGLARRYSATLGTDMLYLALRFHRSDGDGVVRAALPLSEVDATIAAMRLFLLLSAAIGLGAALFMSSLASHYGARGLRRLLERARDLAEGRERGRIVLGSGDELAGIAGSFNRLSDELQRVVAALAQERDRFQAVLEGMEEAVLALDRERRLVLANGAARALLGLGEGALGRTLLETARVPELSALAQAAWEGKQHTAELTLSGPPPRQVLARATPLKAGPGVVLVLRDISELRRLETVRRDFVANASHELRTPVAVIRANAETLLDGALDDPQRARLFLEAIGRNAERLGRLVADVLDVSRLESGAYPLEVQEVELARVVTAAAGALETAIAERGHSLRLDVPPGLTARCDAAALEHALFNLLDNAIKHTPPGSHLEVGCATEEAHVTLTVADDGPGIAPPHRERVFERFYRVDPARSREAGGTGLGLAIVKHLVQAMEGQVGLAPNSPTGSRFFVRLPR